MTPISYYFSVLSPFTYLAGNRLELIANRRQRKIEYRPMDIMGLFAQTGGVPPKDRHISRQRYRTQELARIAEWLSMPINLSPKHWPTDPKPASYAVISAIEEEGDIGLLVQNILQACWANELDIANSKVIEDCLSLAGFDSTKVLQNARTAADIFEANTKKAVEANVFGSPTYVVGDEVFWGQDRLSFLDDLLKEQGYRI